MTRVKGGFKQRRAHKKVLKLAKGFRMSRNRLFRSARQAVVKSGEHQFIGRKLRKRNFRRLWITRISGALSGYGIQYSRFVAALPKANVGLNRKMLSEMAIRDPKGFEQVVETVKKHLVA